MFSVQYISMEISFPDFSRTVQRKILDVVPVPGPSH